MIQFTQTSLGPLEKTSRGFEIVKFKEANGEECSLQQSSARDDGGLIWLGRVDAEPKVLASQAAQFGVKTTETTGWVKFPIPADVLLSTRMHLNKEQVSNLVSVLNCWLNSGSFHDPDINGTQK